MSTKKTTERGKLVAKIFIEGDLVTLTGLHIGGSKSALEIGEIDLNVVKEASGVPMIPGSSLKGKLRSMLARIQGSKSVEEDKDYIPVIFGSPGDKKDKGAVTRLVVRDAFLDTKHFATLGYDQGMETNYTDSKWENTIKRDTGTAEHPRQLERVPANARFAVQLVYDEYEDTPAKEHLKWIRTAMRLLQDDYIGGSGSRGYGRIQFENIQMTRCTVEAYQADQMSYEPYTDLDMNLLHPQNTSN